MEQNELNWIQRELNKLEQSALERQDNADYVKLEEDTPTKLIVEVGNSEWENQEYEEPDKIVLKKKIPVIQEGVHKIFSLNVKNPVYHQIVKKADDAYRRNQNSFEVTVLRIGSGKDTKFRLLKEGEDGNK